MCATVLGYFITVASAVCGAFVALGDPFVGNSYVNVYIIGVLYCAWVGLCVGLLGNE